MPERDRQIQHFRGWQSWSAQDERTLGTCLQGQLNRLPVLLIGAARVNQRFHDMHRWLIANVVRQLDHSRELRRKLGIQWGQIESCRSLPQNLFGRDDRLGEAKHPGPVALNRGQQIPDLSTAPVSDIYEGSTTEFWITARVNVDL